MTSQTGNQAWWRFAAVFIVGGLIGALSVAEVIPRGTLGARGPGVQSGESGDEQVVAAAGGTGADGPSSSDGGGAGGSQSARGSGKSAGKVGSGGGGVTDPAGLECKAGKNGGATDTGVSASEISLAANTVTTGVGKEFLGQVQIGMQAVVDQVNASGGICGRKLNVRYNNDDWSASAGYAAIQNYIAGNPKPVFALTVWPSSEGLRVAIKNRDIRNAPIPVVGVGGMLIDEYSDPWVWPVAVSSASSARIMARDAWSRGARNLSIVFDKNYRFGSEAAEAFNDEYNRLTLAAGQKQDIPGYPNNSCPLQAPKVRYCGLQEGQQDYGTYVQNFDHGDYVAMFLEPATAQTWLTTSGGPNPATSGLTYGVGGAQPLFTRGFADSCKAYCNNMWVWTGYKPYIESYKSDPAVQAFVALLNPDKTGADEYNQFTEGGYLGIQLLVDALKAVGPNLTRTGLQSVLDSINGAKALKNTVSLEPQLSWVAGNHLPAATMKAYVIQSTQAIGWREGPTASDPNPQETAAGIEH